MSVYDSNLGADSQIQLNMLPAPERVFFPDGFAAAPIIDWLEFTCHIPITDCLNGSRSPDRIVRLNEADSIEPSDYLLFLKSSLVSLFGGGSELPHGRYQYTAACCILGTGRVYWNVDRPEMGVHVSLPSSALSIYSATSGQSVVDLLAHLESMGAKCTRLDVAMDTDVVSIADVLRSYEAGQIVTKLQTERIIEGRRRGVSEGVTLYVGSRKGRRMVRFYDKAAEQTAKGRVTEGVWTRAEVEFHREHAQTAFGHLIDGGDPADLIYSTIDFREVDNARVDRCTRCAWWADWIRSATKVLFPVRKASGAVADSMAWIVRSVAPTLSWLSMYMGNTNWLDPVIKDALGRVPVWKWDMLPSMGGT